MARGKRHPAVTEVVEPEKFVLELDLAEATELRETLGKASRSFEVFALLGELLRETGAQS